MTVVDDRIEMADTSDQRALDEMFKTLEPVPEGYRAEIVEGIVYMSPQRRAHWRIIYEISKGLESEFGESVEMLSNSRIDFPGYVNGFCPDVVKIRDGAEPDDQEHWRYQDVEFVAEVISHGTGKNDYGPKKTAYALAGVPVYLIVDPYQRKCHLYTEPKDGDYLKEVIVAFGSELDLKETPLGMTLPTNRFPSG